MQNGCQFHVGIRNSNFIAEVGADLNFSPSYNIRYEVISQVKLSYFSLLKDN